MNLQQFLLILQARYKLGVFILIVTVAAMLVYSVTRPKSYEATTSVLLDVKIPDSLIGTDLPSGRTESYMPTQVNIISSNRVAQMVVRQLKLDENPAIRKQWISETKGKGTLIVWLGELLKRGLSVKPVQGSNIIDITYMAKDPAFATAMANAFAQSYIDTNLELKVEPAKQYAAWFQDRVKGFRDELLKAQANLTEYQQETGIVLPDGHQSSVDHDKISQLSSQLSAMEGEAVDVRSRSMYASSADTMPDIIRNPLIQSIKEKIDTQEGKLQELGQTLGKNHPQYKAAKEQVSVLKQQLKEESQQIMDSFKTENTVNKQKELELKATIEAHKRQVIEDSKKRNHLETLKNDVDSAQKAYDMVMLHYTESNLQSQSNQTNISLLSSAIEPTEPSSPKMLKNFLVSIFLGTMGGLGAILVWEMLDYRVRTAETLGMSTGLPVLIHFTSNSEPTKAWLMKFISKMKFNFGTMRLRKLRLKPKTGSR
ncbi:MAG: chain length determinant protein EpsF [Burkholderiales bacterium]|nr:chain length determinant protein EpsF [Burkholderiales bacterium]